MSKATTDTGVMAVTDMQTAGAIVWWRLSGEISAEALAVAWRAAGLDPTLLSDEASEKMALNRACRAMQEKRLLARPLAGQKGWCLVQERETGAGLTHYTVITARLAPNSTLRLEVEPGQEARAAELEGHFQRYLGVLTAADISNWLARRVYGLKAVALRETGGVYFLPHEAVEGFRTMVKVLRAVSGHEVYEVPALKSHEAIEAILAAVLAEADHEIRTSEELIASGDLGERALRTRTEEAEALRAKVQSYEALLGRSMDAVHRRIEGLEAKITSAIFAATMGDAAERLVS